MGYPLRATETDDFIEEIIVRPVIIAYDQLKQTINIYTEEDITHTIEEAQFINDFFSSVSSEPN